MVTNALPARDLSSPDPEKLLVELIVRRVMGEMESTTSEGTETPTVRSRRIRDQGKKTQTKDSKKKKKKKDSKKKTKKEKSQNLEKTDKMISSIERLLLGLQKSKLEQEDSEQEEIDFDQTAKTSVLSDNSHSTRGNLSSVNKPRDHYFSIGSHGDASVGSSAFYQSIVSKLHPHRNTICIQDEQNELDIPKEIVPIDSSNHSRLQLIPQESDFALAYHPSGTIPIDFSSHSKKHRLEVMLEEGDFVSAYRPTEMRCLALVSHNDMKSAMKDFVLSHKHVLKKFRLTGTSSTMAMLREVFAGEKEMVFGPSCNSGPLGGDAELVALMASGQLGGILFFQDPMTAHPHQADIECLTRQAMVHNTVIATTPTTAMTVVKVFEMALREARAELLPSFFFSLQSPSVAAYKTAQKTKM